jgi:hypothetical protein
MEWVAVRTGETTGGTTAKTVETTGGTVGSEDVPTWHDALTHRGRKTVTSWSCSGSLVTCRG